VEETVDYCLRELRLEAGGFASAQDADTDGVEGLTFTWTREEVPRAELLQPFEHGRYIIRGRLTDEERSALLAVRDHGPGIRRDMLPRIFEPFVTTDDAQGSGLGLAIARELRRLHPELQIDWLAQDPVTRVLEGEGEFSVGEERRSQCRHAFGEERPRVADTPRLTDQFRCVGLPRLYHLTIVIYLNTDRLTLFIVHALFAA